MSNAQWNHDNSVKRPDADLVAEAIGDARFDWGATGNGPVTEAHLADLLRRLDWANNLGTCEQNADALADLLTAVWVYYAQVAGALDELTRWQDPALHGGAADGYHQAMSEVRAFLGLVPPYPVLRPDSPA